MRPIERDYPEEKDKLYILDKEVECPICGHNKFSHRAVLLNSPGMTFFGLEFLNKEASAYTCKKCCYMMYF